MGCLNRTSTVVQLLIPLWKDRLLNWGAERLFQRSNSSLSLYQRSLPRPYRGLLIYPLHPFGKTSLFTTCRGIIDFFAQTSLCPSTMFRRMPVDLKPATNHPVGVRYDASAFKAANVLKKYPRRGVRRGVGFVIWRDCWGMDWV